MSNPHGGGYGQPPGGYGQPPGGWGAPPGGGSQPPGGAGHGPGPQPGPGAGGGWAQPGPGAPQQQDPRGAGWFGQAKDAGYQPDEQEREHAFYAHLFAGLGGFFFCGTVFAVVAPLLVMAMTKERKPFMLYHLNQSVVFQTAFFVLNTAIAMIGGVLTLVCIGYVILMILPITILIQAIYPIAIAFAAKRGEWIEYPAIGPKVLREWKPFFK